MSRLGIRSSKAKSVFQEHVEGPCARIATGQGGKKPDNLTIGP